jgi:DnaJ family protein C protein 9
MSEESDPLLTFFSASEAESLDILYVTLGCTKDASADDLRKAYRKAALRCHPDKHASKSEEERAVLHVEFQKIGFAWAVLSDEKRRKRYVVAWEIGRAQQVLMLSQLRRHWPYRRAQV